VFPGGPSAEISDAFEDSELLDYYEVNPDGSLDHLAQMRSCQGGCSDPVEAVTRRNVDAIIVNRISPHSLMRFYNAGVKVYAADSSSVSSLIDSFIAGELKEIGIDRFATIGKTR
jgi:predicted Fe-Mo cluster-binding NifX family protein